MAHIWVRAEQRDNETRVGVTPEGAKSLLARGMRVTVEASESRVIPTEAYAQVGCEIAETGTWPNAPSEAIIFGLKELPEDGTPLPHRHILFGHAYKGQASGRVLLERFKAGGGTLCDLESLVDETGRRVAAFGYWAGYAGAAVSLMAWIAQQNGGVCGAVEAYRDKDALLEDLRGRLAALGSARPSAIVIGAKGRVGTGAKDLLVAMGSSVTEWDMEETAHGGPFPEILVHDIFVNSIFAREGTPVFVPKEALADSRKLSVIGDVACDPDSAFNPIPLYDRATSWSDPVLRVHDTPALDVMAIDNLPSLLPLESSEDYAAQLLPTLQSADDLTGSVWTRALAEFQKHSSDL
ncbi:saccharopine dehydrogenase [Cognatishimia sp.]|uniref:saccharopine dehydrogenase n=1 Tax=Cognatishimia sp. TaxID=2211648 RepID=UPI0035121402|nr:saccharopine dehydrogenase [Cognatishimia sp.]